MLAETVKKWFYKRYGNRVEQVLVPKRKTIYSSRNAKFMKDMIAMISLRFEDEFSVDSLTEDLKDVLTYPVNLEQMIRNLQHLRRTGLVSIDWQKRTIKREKPLKEYVRKNVIDDKTWSAVVEDWRKINSALQQKRHNANAEYQELLIQK